MVLTPEITVSEITPASEDLLLLPGSDIWLEPDQQDILSRIPAFMDAGMVVGAICGATMGLAQAGLLNSRPHTSNDLDVLGMFCPSYSGSDNYQNVPAVCDGNLITASGLAPVEFAREIFTRLNVMREGTLDAWFSLHTTRKPEYFHALIASMQ
jgi:putative intracellular protease/amidase